MQELHFPSYTFTLKNRENKPYIFDSIRKKYVRLNPEEWVRQHVIAFLLETHNYPKSLVKKRYDLVVFYPDGRIFLLVECKAPQIEINQKSFDQIARYNLEIKATYLMVTNGLHHYYCQMDYQSKQYHFLRDLPVYDGIV